MMSMTGGRALIAGLAAHGIDTVFGIPGTHNLAAYAAMPDYGIRHVSPRHEQGAGYAADGYARSSGRPGVVLTTTGPAILNAAAAAAQAYSDSVPVLFISPGMPLRHPAFGNGLLHEVRDQGAAMAAILGNSHRVTSVEEIPLAVAQCFAEMLAGRPRPSHLEIPLDLLDETAPVTVVGPIACAVQTPARSDVVAAVRALADASAPVVIVGGGAFHAADQVRAFAERLDAPVFATANGKGVLPEDHPLAVGAGVQHPSVVGAVEAADVVIGVGTELAPSDWWIGLPEIGDKLVRIDIDPTMIVANAVPAYPLVGDAAATLDALLAALPEHSRDGGPRAAQLRGRFRADARTEGEPWLEIAAGLAEALPREAIIAADSAMACYYGALSNVPLHRAHSFLYPTGAGTLGFGLPAGIGAKLANPDLAVVVLQGDGGTMFTVAELATAAQLGIALPVVIVDNGGYGEIRNEMVDREEPVHSVALGHPDFARLAESLGCHGLRLDSVADLAAALGKALGADRPTVIHLREHSRAADHMHGDA